MYKDDHSSNCMRYRYIRHQWSPCSPRWFQIVSTMAILCCRQRSMTGWRKDYSRHSCRARDKPGFPSRAYRKRKLQCRLHLCWPKMSMTGHRILFFRLFSNSWMCRFRWEPQWVCIARQCGTLLFLQWCQPWVDKPWLAQSRVHIPAWCRGWQSCFR